MSENRYYLAYWCNEGFESLVDITEYQHWEKVCLLETIRNSKKESKPNPLGQMIGHMKLRMRFNPQREYELYAFMSNPDIDHKAIEEWSYNDPQSLVNWIRGNGVKIASDKREKERAKIV